MNTPFKKRESPLTFNNEQSTSTTTSYSSRPVVAKHSDSDKVKYTAVMDKGIRVRIKIASANKNIQISQFIEEAVLEKLEREGF